MMSFAQLRCFVAVAEELHFGRAAHRLQMTQPPLSRQIALLEQELKVVLFDRSRRSVRLTRAGAAFLDEARRLLRGAERAAETARLVCTGRRGRLSMGFTAASAYRNLGQVLLPIQQRLPEVEISLREMVSGVQLDALSNGELDLAMIRPPVRRDDIESRILHREGLVAAIPRGSDLARSGEPLTPADFDGRDLIMYRPPEARYFHDLITRIFHDAGATPHYPHHLAQIHSMLALVNVGLGAALVPETAAEVRYPGVEFRPVRLPDWGRVELAIAWRRDNGNPALAAALDTLRPPLHGVPVAG
ncbi:LysR family transcriptional regulator [Amycolatopsis panacis]|uniref:LysR family transcriptional regulator n=1 Tax=Amycolatopsis panacis TaxID=2340917 RepID=A0A419I520_9PSEU|nr:LysR family transcriptional regulator [Amycolatopsis panacis]RJQ85601.1 LysR family transcriptional regulator [Amycolatopsis panacis]